MFGTEQVMTVMLEAEELRLLHRDWPANMRLAVCLMPSGECQLLLFRQEEAGLFPQRLRKHLGLRPEEISIHPPVAGFPSRQMKYSDERSLEMLLQETPDIVEDAHDYSVNFSYAMEEGLNPAAFMGVDAMDLDMPAPQDIARPEVAAPNTALQFASCRQPETPQVAKKPSLRNLHFDFEHEATREAEPDAVALQQAGQGLVALVKEAAKSKPSVQNAETAQVATPAGPGAAFLSASDLQMLDQTPEVPAPYVMRFEDGCFEISNGIGPVTEVTDAQSLFLRDDRQLLAVRLTGQRQTMPGNLRIAEALLPNALRSVLLGALGEVQLSCENGYVFVVLAETPPVGEKHQAKATKQTPVAMAVPTAEVVSKKKRPSILGRGLRLFALTAITTVAIFLILGMQPSDPLDQNTQNSPIDWKQFRLSMQSESLG
ncbi:MAG: hypothetical protein ACRBBQ_14730 [Cognatishimia sp.]